MAPGGVTPTAFSRVEGEETATGSVFVKYCPEITIRTSAKILLSKSIFDVKDLPNFYKKYFPFNKNINLGDHFLVKTFFLDSIFEPLYFLKLCPILDDLIFLVGFFFKVS